MHGIRSGQPRSQVIREALEDLIRRRERERLVAKMVAAAQALAADPDARSACLILAEDFLPAENEAPAWAEGPATGNGGREDQGERWWR